MTELSTLYQRPAELLQTLIRFDTTNPPGNEYECIAYLRGLLDELGFETSILALDPSHPNLIVRVKGQGKAAPLLLQGHVDVVTTANQDWTHPPFEGVFADGHVWGRGALDMKGGVAMMLCALMRLQAENITPPGDLIATFLSDEEHHGYYGAGYLVSQHPQLFEGVRYAIGEGGGASVYIDGHHFYPIMVAEKQACWMQLVIRGPGGHASVPHRGTAMAKLGRFLQTLDQKRLPVHITPSVHVMISAYADALPEPISSQLRSLLNPELTDSVLDTLGEEFRFFDALLHNTVNPTVVHGGIQINVIPSEITLDLDGRLLPGYAYDDMIGELCALLGEDFEVRPIQYQPNPMQPDMALYGLFADVLREVDGDGIPVPDVNPGVTDGAFFAQLGIQNYGFLPMRLPPGLDYHGLVHAADERVPMDALHFGVEALYRTLQRFT
jgi:acetylornithine deacetylase/succinyl-diaminopimelate desuccinylase-like protein